MNYLLPDLVRLATDATVLFYDQRGTGRSEVILDPQRLTAQDNVRDLEAVRQHFELERLTLLGHSWGAGLAALYALEDPNRAERMIFVDPIPPRATPYMQQFEAAILARLDEAAQSDLASFGERWSETDDPVLVQREYWKLLTPAYFADPRAVAGMRGDPLCGSRRDGQSWTGLWSSGRLVRRLGLARQACRIAYTHTHYPWCR